MTETTEVKTEVHEVVTEGGDSPTNPLGDLKDAAADFKERYSEVIGKVNSSLEGVDWNQMGRIGKSIGILVAVIVAQILIKGVLDTINLLPVVPGLLELLGLVVVGNWSWNNLSTSTKRDHLVQQVTKLRQEYLG
ncbi:MAG: hypothetical protein RLZZ158_1199 [Cyanobacteriota bacterium]|jgi:hypothetical protein